MRSTYTFLMLLFPALALVNGWWFGRELKAFLSLTPAIASTADIERMKAMVARQMYAALVQIPLLAAGPAVYAYGLYRHVLVRSDVVFVIVPSALVLAAGVALKRVEAAARSLDTPDDELRLQRDVIVDTWLRKPFPDW